MKGVSNEVAGMSATVDEGIDQVTDTMDTLQDIAQSVQEASQVSERFQMQRTTRLPAPRRWPA